VPGAGHAPSPLLRGVGALSLVLFAVLAFTPLAAWLSHVLEPRPRLQPAAAIVVLGGGGLHADGTLADVSLRRTLRGIELYQRGLAPLLLFSGPRTPDGPAEGEVRAALARKLGVPDDAVLTEITARTTREEALRIAGLLLPRGVRRILLVADAQGMRRAAGVFRRAGFDPLPAPADDVTGHPGTPDGRLALAWRVLMETAALSYYRLAGYL
jgi:uncharacterized SAM-binding protein YcdF (DUF218 family)